MTEKIKFKFCLLFLILVPLLVKADFRITEIMYDLSGTDTDREWVELKNTGGAEALKDLRFVDKAGRHLIKGLSSEVELPANSCIVLAKDYTAFKNDFPSFSGLVFESSLSLVNTTDTVSFLKLVDGSESVFDSIVYSSDFGAKGDGNSLHRDGSNLKAGAPSPGVCDEVSGGSSNPPNTPPLDFGNGVSTSTVSNSSSGSFPVEPQIFLKISLPQNGSVGGIINLRAEVVGIDKKPINNARIIWSFGDGESGEGYALSHVWKFPGNYTVVAEASSDIYNSSSRQQIFISKADVGIVDFKEGVDGFLKLKNYSSFEIDLSYWILESGLSKFVFPKNTFLPMSAEISFSNSVTKIYERDDIFLKYPNGSLHFIFHPSLASKDNEKTAGIEVLNDESSASLAKNNIVKKGEESIKLEVSKKISIAESVGPTGDKGNEVDDIRVVNLLAQVGESSLSFGFISILFVISAFCVIFVLFYISSSKVKEIYDETNPDSYTIEEIKDE